MAKQLVVRLDDDTYTALQRYADDTERTLSQVVRLALKALIKPTPAAVVPGDVVVPSDPATRPPLPTTTGGIGSVQQFLRDHGEPASAYSVR